MLPRWKKPKSTVWKLALGGWALLVLGVAYQYSGRLLGDYELDSSSFTQAKLAFIEQEAGFTLPPGSRGLNFFWKQSSSIDPSFWAKVEIRPEEQEALVKSIKEMNVRDEDIAVSFRERIIWWEYDVSRWQLQRAYMSKHGVAHLVVANSKDGTFLYIYFFYL